MEEILKRIIQIRSQRGYSLEYVADKSEMSESAYRKIEKNQVRLSLENFLKIAKALEVSVNELLDEKPHRDYYQHNNNQGTFIGHQEFDNYYQENKEITHQLINNLESNIKYLQDENLFLRNQLFDKHSV